MKYTSDEHGFKAEGTNLPFKLGHAIAPVNGTTRYYPGYPFYPSYYPVPPPAYPPQVVYYPAPKPVPAPAYPVLPAYPVVPVSPADHFLPEVIDAHKRSRRSVYSSDEPDYVSEEHEEPNFYYYEKPAEAPYVPEKPAPKSYAPAGYKPSYQPAYPYARSHIPIEEDTNDVPEEKPAPGPAPKNLFVPALTIVPVPARTTTPPPTTAPPAVVTTPAPAYEPYYPAQPSPAPAYYSPSPSPSPFPSPAPSPSPTPTPAPAPIPEVYIKPVVRHFAPVPEHKYEPRYEPAPVLYSPTPAPTTPPPTPAPTTPPPTPAPSREELYFIPREPRPTPVPVVVPVKAEPVPVHPAAAHLPAVIATPIRSQYHSQDELGQYAYGYSNENSAKHETKTVDGITKGAYSYVDANGHVQNVQYVSDDHHGFRVAATNLPKGPVPVLHDEVVPVPVVVAEHKK